VFVTKRYGQKEYVTTEKTLLKLTCRSTIIKIKKNTPAVTSIEINIVKAAPAGTMKILAAVLSAVSAISSPRGFDFNAILVKSPIPIVLIITRWAANTIVKLTMKGSPHLGLAATDLKVAVGSMKMPINLEITLFFSVGTKDSSA
jgi:hypothetical protein